MTRLGIVVVALSAIATGCVQPELRECSVKCGANGLCPGSYHATCSSDDGYCHLDSESPKRRCDLAGPDLGVADLVTDLTGVDLVGADLAPPPPDLVVQDLTLADLTIPVADLASGDLAMLPPSLCATAGLVFCDGFESATLSSHWLNVLNATVVLGGERGARSLRFDMPAGMTSSQLVTRTPFPALASDIWARSFVDLPASRPGYVVLMEINDGAGSGFLLSAANDSLQLDEYGGATSLVGSVAMPSDQYVCVEWHLGGGQLHAYINGEEVPELAVTGRTLPPWTAFIFSSSLGSPDTAFSTHLDEVALHSSRITCAM